MQSMKTLRWEKPIQSKMATVKIGSTCSEGSILLPLDKQATTVPCLPIP